jgi:integrase
VLQAAFVFLALLVGSVGLCDRALIALTAYIFARVGAATAMKVEDYFVLGRRKWVRLYEKGGKQHEVPAHHNLDDYIEAYIKVAGLRIYAGEEVEVQWYPFREKDHVNTW